MPTCASSAKPERLVLGSNAPDRQKHVFLVVLQNGADRKPACLLKMNDPRSHIPMALDLWM
jgi:hypothetical protein